MKKIKKGFSFLIALVFMMQIIVPLSGSAQTRALDIVTKEKVGYVEHTKSMVSITPSVAAIDVPADVKTVHCTVRVKGYMQYNRLDGTYVSSSSPSITVRSSGRVTLNIQGLSTSKRDNGNSVTFSYSGTLIGTVVSDIGLEVTVDYGSISGSCTFSK